MMARGDVDSLYPAALGPQTGADIRIRHAYGGNSRAIDYSARYGLLRDDSRLAERIEGPARRAPNATFRALPSATYKVGMNMRRGGTPSDPGGYNWDTLKSGLDTAASAVSNIFKLNQYRQTTKQQPSQPLPPPSKPRSARSTVQKPKTTRPILSTYDPSIW